MSTNCTSRYSVPSSCSCALSVLRFTAILPESRLKASGTEVVYNRRADRLQAPAPGETRIMCGIVGFLDKRGGAGRPVGRTLLAMLEALACRGPDSTGVATFDTHDESLRVSIP